ncbi:hypothetical protein [Rhodoblastus sp.]|uniref:hypothetical protein n=1 Tax=Rhodoblastus sp. TaxID=1962975 RepID=UPI0026190D46|nr:hypothetical protein [Rhodoblastus sp.]
MDNRQNGVRRPIPSPSSPSLVSLRRTAASAGDQPPLVLVFVLAFGLTALPVFLHAFGQPLALAVCAALAAAAAMTIEAQVPVIVLTATIFQNVFVSIASVNYTDIHDLDPMKSYNFVTTVVTWLVVMAGFFNRWRSFSPFTRRMIFASCALLAIYGVYFLAGVLINPHSAVVYMRNIGTPILLFQMFLIVAARHELALPRLVVVLLGLMIGAGYTEVLAHDLWLDLTNGWHYLALSYADNASSLKTLDEANRSGVVPVNLVDYGRTDLFNSPMFAALHLTVLRLEGPNLHSISFGYALAALLSFAAIHRRRAAALLAAPLLLLTSAKGPLMLAVFTLVFHEAARRWDPRTALKILALALAAFAVFALAFGFRNGDYHVLGLIGGLNGFIKNPVGHSLGEGGNLSFASFNVIDWSKFQREGAADVAVESAVGVMLFQLGVAAVAAFAFYAWIARTALSLFEHARAPALAFATGAIATTMVNGLFQEEAYFAPLALGLVMGLAGLSLGAADRALAARKPQGAPAPRLRVSQAAGNGAGFSRPAAMRS